MFLNEVIILFESIICATNSFLIFHVCHNYDKLFSIILDSTTRMYYAILVYTSSIKIVYHVRRNNIVLSSS